MTNESTAHAEPIGVPGQVAEGTIREVTWGRALKVWWSLFWRTLLASMLVGALVGAVIGFLMGLAGLGVDVIIPVTQCAGALVSIPVAVWMMHHVLRLRWSDFRIVLVASSR